MSSHKCACYRLQYRGLLVLASNQKLLPVGIHYGILLRLDKAHLVLSAFLQQKSICVISVITGKVCWL